MNRLWYPVVASLLLFTGPAMAGNDFCDNVLALGTDPVPPDPGGGGCEVNLEFRGPGVAEEQATLAVNPSRLRDMPFNQSFYAALSSGSVITTRDHLKIDFAICSASLGSSPVLDTEASLVEWSFESEDKSDAARVLALSLRREGRDLVLNMDWLSPPDRDWSVVTHPGTEPILLDNQRIKLGVMPRDSTQFARLPLLYLKRDGRTVYVGLGEKGQKAQEFRFELPGAGWLPVRLRNGLLRSSQLQDGMKVHLSWPGAFRNVDARWGPSQPPIDPPESPVQNPVE